MRMCFSSSPSGAHHVHRNQCGGRSACYPIWSSSLCRQSVPGNYVLLKFIAGISESQRQKVWNMVKSRFDWAVRKADAIRVSGVTLAEA